MAATHEYLCVVRLHVWIDYQNVSIVNFAWGQKVVPAGWLPAAERLELRHEYKGVILALIKQNHFLSPITWVTSEFNT